MTSDTSVSCTMFLSYVMAQTMHSNEAFIGYIGGS